MKSKGGIQPSLAQYVLDITARFGEFFDDPMSDLKALQQTGDVQTYHDAFNTLASRGIPSQLLSGRIRRGCADGSKDV